MEKLSGTIEARKDPEEYWKEIMKDQQMPEGLQGLLPFQSENNPKTQEQLVKDSKHECEDPLDTNVVSQYGDFELKLSAKKDNIEPRPSASNYGDFELKLSASKKGDIEPRPSATNYGDFELKSRASKKDDIEPKPSATKYGEFEPRPSATKYDDF